MRQVSVVVIEPWSRVTQHGPHSTADVVATDGDLMLLEMDGQFYVATPRGANEEPTFSLIPTTTEHFQRGTPWGRDEWRGAPDALLAEVRSI